MKNPTRTPSVPKQTVDQMAASRTFQKLPAPPVFRRDVVPVPVGGRGKKVVADLEAVARANAEAAEEARRVALAQRSALEEIAAGRVEAERLLAHMKHEILEERAEHERLVAQARFRAIQEERRRLGVDVLGGDAPSAPPAGDRRGHPPVAANPSKPSPTSTREFRTLQTQLAEREQAGESHRQRLLEALRERDAARLELQRVSDARMHAERRLERVTEVLHRATSAGGPRPAGGDGVEEQHVRALRDELAVAIARAKSAEARTNELRDEIESVKNQRTSTSETLEATRGDLDAARDELSVLHARLIGLEAAQSASGSAGEEMDAVNAHAREIEREVVEARGRAVAAEQRVAELAAALQSTTGHAEESETTIATLKVELAEARTESERSEAKVAELLERTERIEADLALATAAHNEAQARLRATEGELDDVGGARSELDEYVAELRSTVERHEARVAELELQLDAAISDHGAHAIDLEATHAATAAELTSASARAEHLASEIASRDERIEQLDATLAATTAELGELVGRTGELDGDLANRDARIADLQAQLQTSLDARAATEADLAELTTEAAVSIETRESLKSQLAALAGELDARDGRLEELDAALTAAVAESSAAAAQLDELSGVAEQLEAALAAHALSEEALATARAERDVAVAQADSLTLELGQRATEIASAEARLGQLEQELTNVGADHGDVVSRLDDLATELTALRAERDELLDARSALADRCEMIDAEMDATRQRAEELESTRSADRRLAEKAIDSLRAKAESTAASLALAEEEVGTQRARHSAEMERMTAELEAARQQVDVVDIELSRRREREEDLRRALTVAEKERSAIAEQLAAAIATPAVTAAPAAEVPASKRNRDAGVRTAPRPSVPAGAPPERVPAEAAVRAEDSTADRPPSELRRAVFASLTELAGD